MRPIIMKFGGTSVEDARAFRRAAQIVKARANDHPLVVVSAMARFTDALLAGVRSAVEGDADSASARIEEHLGRHTEAAAELLVATELEDARSAIEVARRKIEELLRILAAHPATRAPLQDEVVSHGERLSAMLLAAALRAIEVDAVCVDARRCVITDERHGSAAPVMEACKTQTRVACEPLIAGNKVPVLGGFIGSTRDGTTTTLGRGGSDYTASIVGAALGAREIQIWTDVAGVLTADPRIVPETQTVAQLSYDEAAELAYFGAKVLHPKTIQPAVEGNIPVRICNSREPLLRGTIVGADAKNAPHAVKAIAHKTGITVVQISSARMLGAYGFLEAVFKIFDRYRTPIDVVTTSEVSISLTIDDAAALDSIVKELEPLGSVSVEPRQAIICVVGAGLRGTPGIASRVFGKVGDINVAMISQGASSINLTFVVDESQADEVVRRLHQEFFEQRISEAARTSSLRSAV